MALRSAYLMLSTLVMSLVLLAPLAAAAGVELTVEVPDKRYTQTDEVPATITVGTDRAIRLQYLLFAKDRDGDVVYSYPFPPYELEAGTERTFEETVQLDVHIPNGDYYFTALAFGEGDEVIAAFDETVDVFNSALIMEVVVDCFDTAEDKDSNLCVYQLGTTGYVRVELRAMDGTTVTTDPKVSGTVTVGGQETAIAFQGLIGSFAVPADAGEYAGVITATAEGHSPATKEFPFHAMDTTAVRVNCDLDGECGPFESFDTCPEDCESGLLDWSCDQVSDGKCDPDCLPEEDIDCGCEPGSCTEEEERRQVESSIIAEQVKLFKLESDLLAIEERLSGGKEGLETGPELSIEEATGAITTVESLKKKAAEEKGRLAALKSSVEMDDPTRLKQELAGIQENLAAMVRDAGEVTALLATPTPAQPGGDVVGPSGASPGATPAAGEDEPAAPPGEGSDRTLLLGIVAVVVIAGAVLISRRK